LIARFMTNDNSESDLIDCPQLEALFDVLANVGDVGHG